MNYGGRPTPLDIYVIGERDALSVSIHAEARVRGAKASPIVIGVQVLNDIRELLVDALAEYRSDRSFTKLKSLAKIGHDAFNSLVASLTLEQRRRWANIFEAPPELRQSVVRVNFEAGVSFPFSLLCTSPPKTNNYEQLVRKFLGGRAVVVNTAGRLATRPGDQIFVQLGPPCKIAHAFDSEVPGAGLERNYIERIPGLEVKRCITRAQLLAAWNRSQTGIVHFSSHHKYDDENGQYVLSLSNGERFQAISDIGSLRRNPAKGLPFVFLNGCNTGWMNPEKPDTFAGRLSPNHAVGILATLYSVGGEEAARFARLFYKNWISSHFAIDALTSTKQKIMFKEQDFTSVAYELWETPEGLSLFKD